MIKDSSRIKKSILPNSFYCCCDSLWDRFKFIFYICCLRNSYLTLLITRLWKYGQEILVRQPHMRLCMHSCTHQMENVMDSIVSSWKYERKSGCQCLALQWEIWGTNWDSMVSIMGTSVFQCTQLTVTCSNSIIETLEKGVKYVQR